MPYTRSLAGIVGEPSERIRLPSPSAPFQVLLLLVSTFSEYIAAADLARFESAAKRRGATRSLSVLRFVRRWCRRRHAKHLRFPPVQQHFTQTGNSIIRPAISSVKLYCHQHRRRLLRRRHRRRQSRDRLLLNPTSRSLGSAR